MSINRHEPQQAASKEHSRSSSTSNSNQQQHQQQQHLENGGSNYSGSSSSLNSVGGNANAGGNAYANINYYQQQQQHQHHGSNHHLSQWPTVPSPAPPSPHLQNHLHQQHYQNSIPSNAIRTPATAIHHTSKHVRSRSAVEPLISYGGLGPPPPSTLPSSHSPSNHHHHLSSHHYTNHHHLSKNAVNSLIASSSSIPSPTRPGSSSLSPFLSSIEEKVARVYYRHGLFCARHSLVVIAASLLMVTIAAYPIVTFLGLFGSSSEVYVVPGFAASFSSDGSDLHSPLSEATTATFSGGGKGPLHRHDKASEGHSKGGAKSSLLLQTETADTFLRHLYFWKNYPNYSASASSSSSSSSSSSATSSPQYQNVPRWFQPNLSYAFVQQIYVRSAVIPWTADMQLVDALRGPLDVLFELVESISNYQQPTNETDSPVSLADLCLQVFEPSLGSRYSHLSAHLPAYGCLVLSPANVWAHDPARFRSDTDFLSTLLHFQDTTASPLPVGTLHNLLFGVPFEETGIRRAYGRNRQRTITFAITLAFRRHSPSYIDGLRAFLVAKYPLSKVYYEGGDADGKASNTVDGNHSEHQQNGSVRSGDEEEDEEEEQYHASSETEHVFYQNTFTSAYLVPLFLFYASVCLYMYFTVRKIEIVRNRLLFPAAAFLTVLMSVFMSFGICFRLNFNSVLTVNRLLPYFVGFISFENMLVLSKSFLTQYPHLDTKVRVAQGLSLDGLGITKNLMTELTLLMFGSLLFSPFFQECCIFAAVCLFSDYFIQVTFFTSFISMNISPINERNKLKKNKDNHLMGNGVGGKLPKSIYAQPGKPELKKTPKRVRIIYFFARIRIVQRLFILLLCACIGIAIYNAYLVLDQAPAVGDDLRGPSMANATKQSRGSGANKAINGNSSGAPPKMPVVDQVKTAAASSSGDQPDHHSLIELLKSSSPEESSSLGNLSEKATVSAPTRSSAFATKPVSPFGRIRFSYSHPAPASMPAHHWSNLFSLYNVSLTGRFLTVLPPILLSIPVKPERAKVIRNVADADDEMLLKFVPTKFSNGEKVVVDDDFDEYEHTRPVHFFAHWTRTDAYTYIGLAIPSSIFLLYAFILMYRCVCTRNYAEWRTQLSTSLSTYRRRQFGLLDTFTSFVLRRPNRSNSGYSRLETEEMERYLHFDVHLLRDDEEREAYRTESQYLLNHQDIDLIATCSQNALVACCSMSGDIRVYDALTCENLVYIKRSKTASAVMATAAGNGRSSVSPPEDSFSGEHSSHAMEIASPSQQMQLRRRQLLPSSTPNSHSNASLVARTSGNLLKTIIDGISVEDSHDEDEEDPQGSNGCCSSPLGGLPYQPVWCLDIFDRYVLAGCGGGDGRLEVWDAHTGQLAYVHQATTAAAANSTSSSDLSEEESKAITAMRVTFWGVALARIDGSIELLEAEQRKDVKYCLPAAGGGGGTSSHNRMANSGGGGGGPGGPGGCSSLVETQFSIKYRLKHTIQAHQQPITRMEVIDSLEDEDFLKAFGSRGCLITGSLDNTLKVFALDQAKFVYTLNGHCGGISTTSIDQYSTATALSGCQLGQLFVWDLNTGTCIFSMQAHSQAEVLAITASQLYYVSSGTDCRICIWDRYSGHLVHQMNQQHSQCRNMMFLEAHILITVRDYELVVWDVNDARQMCIVSLANNNGGGGGQAVERTNTGVNGEDLGGGSNSLERRRSSLNHHHQHSSSSSFDSMIRTYQTAAIQRLCFAVQQKVLLCDYGNSLCVISNPFAAKKLD